MNLRKVILCMAAALATFGLSVGVNKLNYYLYTMLSPTNEKVTDVSSVRELPTVNYQAPIIENESPDLSKSEDYRNTDFAEFGPNGYFYIFGTEPKGFKNFEYIELGTSVYDYKTKKSFPTKPSGWVIAGVGYKYSQIKVTSKKLFFSTIKYKGIHYTFAGKFVHEKFTGKNVDGEDYADEVVLKGRFTKRKNGVKIAEAELKFGFTIGC